MANVKVNDTSVFPVTTPAPGDLLFGTDVSNTTVDPNGKVVNFTVASVKGWTEVAPVTTTSGTEVSFGSIPAGVQEVEVFLRAVGTSSAADYVVRVGDAGSLLTTGYSSSSSFYVLGGASAGATVTDSTGGFIAERGAAVSPGLTGTMRLSRQSGNVWSALGIFRAPATVVSCAGFIDLTNELNIVGLTTLASTFNAGSVSIKYR